MGSFFGKSAQAARAYAPQSAGVLPFSLSFICYVLYAKKRVRACRSVGADLSFGLFILFSATIPYGAGEGSPRIYDTRAYSISYLPAPEG